MSIFKIVKNESVVVKPQMIADDQDEMRQAMAVVGEAPSLKAKQEGVSEDNKPDAFNMDKENIEDIVVKVDGPLGRVFTEALNKVLALEGMSAFPLAQLNPAKPVKTLHIHALDEETLMTGDLVEISQEISKLKNELFVVAVESSVPGARVFGKKTMFANTLIGEMPNCQIRYTVEGAVGKTMDAIRKLMSC